MTCEIRVSTKFNQGNDESLFSINNGSPDQAGAIVALAARKAVEGKIGSDRYDVFENILEWLDNDCPNWELLPRLGRGFEIVYYYHIKLSNGRDGKLEIEIGFSQWGQTVKYHSVNEFICLVNEARKQYNKLIDFSERNLLIPKEFYTDFRMLRLPGVS